MEWELFLITMGLLMGFCFLGVGICIGRLYQDVSDGNSDSSDSPADSSGMDRSVDRDPPTPEEIVNVLYVLRIGASNREKRVLDHLIDQEEGDNDD